MGILIKLFALGVVGLVLLLVLPLTLVIAGGAVVFALGIVGLVLGAVVFGFLGLSAVFLLPFLIVFGLIGLIFGFFGHPVIEIVFVSALLYVIYRWWQHRRAYTVF
ncbi:hypothetical protein HYR54_16600 [Candidatus Acetothermia bacterium]|nr:hypothetical protein [Candidatus Acetothermia bacterium]